MTGITAAPKQLFLINKESLTQKQQELIKKWFKRIPDLEVLKKGLREIYASKDYQHAKRRLDTIILGLSKTTSDWAKTLERWYDPILNYFEYMITSGYTEGMHTKFKLLKRLGFSFINKVVYIRKMTLGCLSLALYTNPLLWREPICACNSRQKFVYSLVLQLGWISPAVWILS